MWTYGSSGVIMNKEEKWKISTYQDVYCEEDGKQTDICCYYKYYWVEKKVFVFGGSNCFVCDNELFLEIEENKISEYFDGEELKFLLEDRENELIWK